MTKTAPEQTGRPRERTEIVAFQVGGDLWMGLDEFIRRYGRAEAERRLGEAGLRLNPEYASAKAV